MTIIVRVGHPKPTANIGDYWFDPTTKETHQYIGVSAFNSLMPTSAWAKVNPAPGIPKHPNKGDVIVCPVTLIPELWDGHSWIPAVPSNYNFPHPNPMVGEVWTEPMSQTQYIYFGGKWCEMLGVTHGPNSNGAGISQLPAGQSNGLVINPTGNVQPLINSSLLHLQIIGPNGPMVTLDTITGAINYGLNYTPDAAAQIFWRAIAQTSPRFLQNQIDNLVQDLKHTTSRLAIAEGNVLKFIEAGYKLPEPPKPFDPNDSWDSAMGIIK